MMSKKKSKQKFLMPDNEKNIATITIPICDYMWIGNAFNEASECLSDEEYGAKMRGEKKEIESFYTKFREGFARFKMDDVKTVTFHVTAKELSWMVNALGCEPNLLC